MRRFGIRIAKRIGFRVVSPKGLLRFNRKKTYRGKRLTSISDEYQFTARRSGGPLQTIGMGIKRIGRLRRYRSAATDDGNPTGHEYRHVRNAVFGFEHDIPRIENHFLQFAEETFWNVINPTYFARLGKKGRERKTAWTDLEKQFDRASAERLGRGDSRMWTFLHRAKEYVCARHPSRFSLMRKIIAMNRIPSLKRDLRLLNAIPRPGEQRPLTARYFRRIRGPLFRLLQHLSGP
ncbi:MAG: hypothetical protein AABX02_04550 [archaeon]